MTSTQNGDEQVIHPCTVCGRNVVVHAQDVPENPADVTGGYMHFGCMERES